MNKVPGEDLKHYVRAMSSLEVAQITGKQHKHVMRDIRNMVKVLQCNQPKFGSVNEISYLDKKGESRIAYELDYEHTMTLITGYNIVLRNLVIKRWLELEDINSQLVKARIDTKEHFHAMMDALSAINQAEYNRPAPHYLRSNNCDMLNKIVIGMSAKKYRAEYCLSPEVEIRNHFTDKELKLLVHLEITNTTLIRAGLDYTTRKEILNNSTGDTK